jgi:class 3 adenylate cyclase/ketosteroid isomerase-like protein
VAPDIPAAGPSRKTVTVMFADLAGSTSFEERVDAETAREVIGRYHDLLRSTAERHRAGTTKYIGDGFMAVWGVPEIGPDDAANAVDAAVELQDRFVDLATHVADIHGVALALRVAVNTGEVVVGAGDADLVGDALNVGARLEAECPRGRVVVGEETWRSTRGRYAYESLGDVQVKGRTAPVAVYQWLDRQSDAIDAAPFVGRADEVRRLQSVLDDAVTARTARLVTVIGDPGVGKSRLAAEFVNAQSDARLIQARCDVHRTVALGPIIELLRARELEIDIPASVPERDRLLRDLNGLATGVPGSVEENFWALRRFIEVLAWNGPILLVLDDIQWADTLLLDFIEHLVEWVHETPVLVLALARPELREIRPDLVTVGRWASEAIYLGGLDAGATAELAAKVLGADQLPDELVRRLPSSTGGNPLFVRELVGMLAHDGVLVEEPTGWRLTIDVDAITIPPTIHALLASRLERLDRTDRRVLEIASVIGSDFSVGTVGALADSSADGITLSLNRLRRLELAQPSGTYVGDEPVWRFHHVLIRDVSYRRLLKSDRADLHERLANWVEAGGSSVAFDSDEMAARHLEAAHGYRTELGTRDEHTGNLAVQSARHYAASARRAIDRDELVSAGNQAARGAALANADPAVHAELLLIGCEAFLSAGDVAAGAPLVDELERISDDALEPWATCYRCQFVVYTDPERLPEVDARLQEAIDEFGRRADPAGLAKAHRVRAGARLRLGRVGDGEVDLFDALIAARQSGDHRQITAALGAAPGAALWGPSPVPKAGGRCLDVVRMQRMTTAAPSLEATSMRHLAVLELLRGRPDKARTMLADARQIVADLGLRHGLMETELFAGIIESMEGDPVAAEPHFRTALEGLDALGVGADAGLAAALLARSVLAQGRIDEADRYAAESEHLAGRNLKTAIAWRAVRAEILAAQGRHDDAAAMARDAVAVAAGTDIVLDHAEACLALSRVLATAGDTKGANAARENADRLYAAKEVARSISRTAASVVDAVSAPTTVESAPQTSRLAVTNESCEVLLVYNDALNAGDVEGAVRCYADEFVYADRRRISGDPVHGRDALRAAMTRVFEQYTQYEFRVLAVRGRHLALHWSLMSDDHGNETNTLDVAEADDDGRLVYHGRFDEGDFEGAYRELERRYYAGEGAAFAEPGTIGTEWQVALNAGDYDRVFDEFSTTDLRVEDRSRSAFPIRSAEDLRTSFEQFDAMVDSARIWLPVIYWLSPALVVARFEREATGQDGQQYSWSRLFAFEVHDGRLASMCYFELEDEEAAFAYAEERVRATASRLAVDNQASGILGALMLALQAHDLDSWMAGHSDRFVYDDRRRLSGDPVEGLVAFRTACERFLEQYPHFEWRALAVRGARLVLAWSRWWDDAGNETSSFNLFEADDDRIESHVRFDEDDFEGAYRELEQRYYTGEGAAFDEAGAVTTDWMIALNQGDFDRLFAELTDPDFRLQTRTLSVFGEPSTAELRASFEELDTMVASARAWCSALCWISPALAVARLEREAIGPDGEKYSWARLHVVEIRGGRLASDCRFDVEDEESAFAYAEDRMRASTSRLAVANSASETVDALIDAILANDVDRAIACYDDQFVCDDRRNLSGDPIRDKSVMRVAIERLLAQYSRFEPRRLAVRGERLQLGLGRFSNEDGYETTYLNVYEVGDDRRIVYEGRFDDDDFEAAYRELERRYYATEGAAFAEAWPTSTDWVIAVNQGDFEKAFDELSSPDWRVENRSRSAFPDRSADEVRASLDELQSMVAAARTWNAVIRWLSPNWVVARQEREAVGREGEHYEWVRLVVGEFRDGRNASACEFDLDDEESAFAYAEDRMRAATSRLMVRNRASEKVEALLRAMRAADIDGAVACYADPLVYEDHRRLSGDPVRSVVDMRAAIERILTQYNHFDVRPLAVRGERLYLFANRWSNDAGYETAYLHLYEIGDDGLIHFEDRFDEDDFEGAYRELDRRYYAGEGAEFAEAGAVGTDVTFAFNRGDLDRVFGELTTPDFRLVTRTRSVFGDRTATELRSSNEELSSMVASTRIWHSAVCWLSPCICVGRNERESVGHDGEQYAWTRLYAYELREGRLASMCEFGLGDEDAAFAYAQERMRAATSRLPVTNRASDTTLNFIAALRANDLDGALTFFSDGFVFDDRRRLSGAPLDDLRMGLSRILDQYNSFEWETLAVRGERLHLFWGKWSDEAGNESSYLFVREAGDDGRIEYEGRFDEDDFEGAYRELERRYYGGEGAAFAEGGTLATDWLIALSRGDFDRLFGELTDPGMRVENRSSSAFGDRSASDVRATFEELSGMVASVRAWHSAVYWLSPSLFVARFERKAVGRDGELYAWTHIHVSEIRGGRFTFACQFEVDDEEAAFAYAEERVREAASRLAVTNRASETVTAGFRAIQRRDVDSMVARYSDQFVYEDRRRLSGNPVDDLTALRSNFAVFVDQYSRFEWRTLAVRGQCLALVSSHCSNDAGFETGWLHAYQVGADGLIYYEGRFDEDDFEGAYRELEQRYYAGEGAEFAGSGVMASDWVIAVNRSDFDRAFNELTDPEVRFEDRSRSGFPDRSVAEMRASTEDVYAMVASVRVWNSAIHWLSPTWVVARQEREALGRDGERYAWDRLVVSKILDGVIASVCEFEIEDEEAAFAYAAERGRASTSRLTLTNRSSRAWDAAWRASKAHDVDAALGCYAEEFVFDDRRRLGGQPLGDLRSAIESIHKQYNHFEGRTLAVRGERLHLGWTRWSNESGFETSYLIVHEVDDDGCIVYEGRFDEDDFEGAYRELTRRYCAGEGAAFAEAATLAAEWLMALNDDDFDRLFGEFSDPEMRVENRSSSAFPDRSAAELRASLEELSAMVASTRTWHSAEFWLDSTCGVVRQERQAVGHDGERYAWTRLYVYETRDGRGIGFCEFDLDDEAAAFAYAEERVRAAPSRLTLTNRASQTAHALIRALEAHEVDSALECWSDRIFFDDRRHLSGDPIRDRAALRVAVERIFEQYSQFEGRTLAVRGERLHLGWTRWSNESGFETSYLVVHEVDDEGRLDYDGRFDEDDFEGAYRELERRYYAGEGAPCAEGGAAQTEWLVALNRGDLDRLFGELTAPEMRFEIRSSSAFPESSAAEARVALDDFNATVASAQTWLSAVSWVSPSCSVSRMERKAVGHEGEQYAWTRLSAVEFRDGQMTSEREFDLDDEATAFAYAEERVRRATDS